MGPRMGRCTPMCYSSNIESEFGLSATSKRHTRLRVYPGVLPNMVGMGSKRASMSLMTKNDFLARRSGESIGKFKHRRTGLKNLGGLRQNLWAYSKFWGLIFGSLVSNLGLFGPKKGPLLKIWAYLGSKKRSSPENWGLSKCWGLGQGGCSPPSRAPMVNTCSSCTITCS